VGQPAFATALTGSQSADDGGLVWEWWYEVQVTENITITPALIDLSRPLGQTTPLGRGSHQLAVATLVASPFWGNDW
jgi:hypothetical protein